MAAPLIVTASPAWAHHEVVVAASMPALLSGLALIGTAGLAAWHRWRRDKAAAIEQQSKIERAASTKQVG